MAPNLKHKRSAARLISPPFPTASSTMIFETAREDRWSGDSVPSDGYSSLFTSGFMQQHNAKQPSVASFETPPIIRGPFHPSPEKISVTRPSSDRLSPPKASPERLSAGKLSPHDSFTTPGRRRRSSIIHTTPMSASPRKFKSGGMDAGVERALDNVMRSLRVMAMGTPRTPRSPPQDESRWSSSSEESVGTTEDVAFWRPRKSGESTRSKITIGTMRSGRSTKSRKSRKSEDTDRMDIDTEAVPPVPAPVPVTPGRRKRMMEGLVKRLGLTPKKKNLPEPPALQPTEPTTPRLPRKSSLSTLRGAITKKTSTGTLRSIRSTKSTHPFIGTGPTLDCEAFPPLPRWNDGEHGDGCMPTTPRRRTPKSSIGQPRLQPSTSPNTFLRGMPRRAPGTPKEGTPELPSMSSDNEISVPARVGTPPPDPFAVSLQDKLRRAAEISRSAREATPELSPMGLAYGTPGTDTSSAIATPLGNDSSCREQSDISFDTPPLTHRAAQNALKPKRLLNLLPSQQRLNMGLQTPPSTGLRQKKTAMRPPLGDKTNIPLNLRGLGTPDSISSVLAKADKAGLPKAPSRFDLATASPITNPQFARRDPRGIISRYNLPKPSPDLPFRAGGGDGWGTPAVETQGYFDSTFGGMPLSTTRSRPSVPDFSASPDVSFSESVTSSLRRRDSDASMDSDLPTEEWELEAYLQDLDRIDRERTSIDTVGMGR